MSRASRLVAHVAEPRHVQNRSFRPSQSRAPCAYLRRRTRRRALPPSGPTHSWHCDECVDTLIALWLQRLDAQRSAPGHEFNEQSCPGQGCNRPGARKRCVRQVDSQSNPNHICMALCITIHDRHLDVHVCSASINIWTTYCCLGHEAVCDRVLHNPKMTLFVQIMHTELLYAKCKQSSWRHIFHKVGITRWI